VWNLKKQAKMQMQIKKIQNPFMSNKVLTKYDVGLEIDKL